MTFDGQLYGIPYSVENIALFRNTDLVDACPATMEDLVATGEALVADRQGHRDHGRCRSARPATRTTSIRCSRRAAARSSATTAEGDPDPDNVTVDSPRLHRRRRADQGASARRATGPSRRRSTTPTPSRCSSTRRRRSSSPARGPSPTSRRPAPSTTSARSRRCGRQGPAGPFVGVNGFYLASKGKNKALAQEFATNFLTTAGSPVGLLRGRAAASRAARSPLDERQGDRPRHRQVPGRRRGRHHPAGHPGDGPGLGPVRRRRSGHRQG